MVNSITKPERTDVEDEINWLLGEWSSSPSALPVAPTVPRVGGTEMNGYIPTMFQPSTGLDQAIDAITGTTQQPAQRSKSEIDKTLSDIEENNSYRETTRDGFILPQEFYLAPEPVEPILDALDDEIANTSSAWSDLKQGQILDSPSTSIQDSSLEDISQSNVPTADVSPITLEDVLAVGRAAQASAKAKEATTANPTTVTQSESLTEPESNDFTNPVDSEVNTLDSDGLTDK